MLSVKDDVTRKEILEVTGVILMKDFKVKSAVRKRIDYLKKYIRENALKGFVLGVSGGVDSTAAGKIAQLAVSELRDDGYDAKLIAMRLPYKTQADEDDAMKAIDFINPDEVITVNIDSGTDSVFNSILSGMQVSGFKINDNVSSLDFTKGNVKARMRMLTQYAIAGLRGCVVLGTDNSAEFVTGFYTYY